MAACGWWRAAPRGDAPTAPSQAADAPPEPRTSDAAPTSSPADLARAKKGTVPGPRSGGRPTPPARARQAPDSRNKPGCANPVLQTRFCKPGCATKLPSLGQPVQENRPRRRGGTNPVLQTRFSDVKNVTKIGIFASVGKPGLYPGQIGGVFVELMGTTPPRGRPVQENRPRRRGGTNPVLQTRFSDTGKF